MASRTRAAAVALGTVAVVAAATVAGVAAADPTTTPSATPSSGAAPSSGVGTPGGERFGRGGHRMGEQLAAALAGKLGVEQAKVTAALQKFREAHRPAAPPSPGSAPDPSGRPDPAARDAELAAFLADELGVDQAKVTSALADLRAEHQAQQAAALKTRLDAAVKAGTLTQAEADAVTKAVQQGVIRVGPR